FVARNSARAYELGEIVLVEQILHSLRLQILLLERRLEKYLLNNHLLINAEALMFAGALLECREAPRWWLTGESLLKTQLSKQILPDGGQVERSPSYQAWLLEHIVDVRDLVHWTKPKGNIESLLQNYAWRMADFLRQIKHPDGQIPLLNDSAMDFAASKVELDVLLARAGAVATVDFQPQSDISILSDSGYGVIRDPASGSHLILDCGPLGPVYQLGHGHCDVLSFELSLRGQRLVVDTGTSTYRAGKKRHYERSTAAHNTLRIDGEDQAELWSSYRVGRNPRVGSIRGGHIEESPFLRGEHYAYDRQNVTHCRTVVRRPNDCWIILDYLYGTGRHKVESFLHLHPLVHVKHRNLNCFLSFASDRYVLTTYGVDELTLTESYYSPGYGVRQTGATIHCKRQGSLPMILGFVLRPAASESPSIRFDGGKRVTIDGVVVPLRHAESGTGES
ncbi:MAG: heparinase II/III family protein, partial [Terriglobales bacterium]